VGLSSRVTPPSTPDGPVATPSPTDTPRFPDRRARNLGFLAIAVGVLAAVVIGLVVRPTREAPAVVIVVYLLVFSLVRFAGAWWLRYQDRWAFPARDSSQGTADTSLATVWSEYLYAVIVQLGICLILGFGAATVVPALQAVVPFVALAFLGLGVMYLFLRPFARNRILEP